ncbi:MAG: hypothetical protein CVV04_10305 [Firmicutes bacterium HGW-Firmicutes-9]|nr:MAG: hypothetical protein CVV04_10305 [Firmicutes bacterium HGW-Firmicutes-9]
MKRKIVLLTTIILTLSLAMTACTQGSVSEAKAKELALDNINKVFQTNQTEATVTREQMGCLPDQVGAMATTGNAEDTSRWLYIVDVPSRDVPNYQAYVVESTGEVIFLSQNENNIKLTDEQQKQAETLLASEPSFGREHEKEVAKLKEACKEWAIANLNDSHPILLNALRGRMPDQAVRESFSVDFYVVTNDARVYCVTMYWPSMQVLNIDVENAK